MKVGLDVMGGDYAPESVMKGAILARQELAETDTIVLFGDEKLILDHIRTFNGNPDQFIIEHAPDVIDMHDQPIKVFTQKPDSGIVKGVKKLKQGQIDSFASAGNSGAVLVSAIYSVGNVPGIIRPTTCALIPRENGSAMVLLDIGTVPDAKPDLLFQFAILGSLFAEHILQIDNPSVCLMNIGEEKEKGNIVTQAAYQLMKDAAAFNFQGNVEGRDIFTEKADVIVCDGFTGNVILKQIEGMYEMLKKRKLSDDHIERFNYENYGGSPILGINSNVVIGHGISNDIAIKNMIKFSVEIHNSGLHQKISDAFSNSVQNKS